MSEPRFHTFDNEAAWADAGATLLAESLKEGLIGFGRATFAGAGGSTPAPIYERLSQTDLDWANIAITLVDERNVPESSPDSNARLMRQTLLVNRAAAAKFIPLWEPAVTVDRAALIASRKLSEIPPFDAVLLGMGEDGHICSMFPGSPTLKALLGPTPPAVVGVPQGRDGKAPDQERLSVNLTSLVPADRIVLAFKGRAKREAFEREARGDPMVHPIAAILANNVDFEVVWMEQG